MSIHATDSPGPPGMGYPVGGVSAASYQSARDSSELEIAVRWLSWFGFPLLLFLLPNSVRPSGVPVAPESVLAVVVLSFLVVGDCTLDGGRGLLQALRRMPLPLYGLVLLLMLSRLRGVPEVELLDVGRPLLWVLTLLLGVLTALDGRRFRSLLRIWTCCAVVCATLFLCQPSLWGALRVDLGAWEHRTTFAFFLTVPAMIHCSRLLAPSEARGRAFDALLSLVLLSAIVIARSRGPWLVLYAALVVHASLHARRKLRTVVGLLLLLAFLVGIALHTDADLATRLRGTWDFDVRSSAPYRIDLYQAAFCSIPEVGPLGAGPGSAGPVLHGHTRVAYPHLVSGEFSTDADLIWFLVEAGPFACLCLLVLLVVWARRLVKFRSCSRHDASDVAAPVSLFMLFTGMVIFDNILSTPLGWYLLGVGLAASGRSESTSKVSGGRV